jgi:hypothetical protein
MIGFVPRSRFDQLTGGIPFRVASHSLGIDYTLQIHKGKASTSRGRGNSGTRRAEETLMADVDLLEVEI